MSRVYLDHNATTPLRAEARAAMLAAMDVVGNPSSVHGEGRAAKAILERARGQVAALIGIERNEVVFTSGATEAAAQVAQLGSFACSDIEHDCVQAHQDCYLRCDAMGLVEVRDQPLGGILAMQAANSETGVCQQTFAGAQIAWRNGAMVLVDAVQAAGKLHIDLAQSGADFMLLSAHKLGGPKGVGAIGLKLGVDAPTFIPGGGQEMGRRSGTENIIGIAGFGAAAEAAKRDLDAGHWDRVAELRNILEKALAEVSRETIFVGKEGARLPNTSCFITPGWKGETQVMQMDLAGFAISAGSACSSGKVKASRVLKAMGYGDLEAASAVRVSLGLETTEDEIMRFVEAWASAFERWKARAA